MAVAIPLVWKFELADDWPMSGGLGRCFFRGKNFIVQISLNVQIKRDKVVRPKPNERINKNLGTKYF